MEASSEKSSPTLRSPELFNLLPALQTTKFDIGLPGFSLRMDDDEKRSSGQSDNSFFLLHPPTQKSSNVKLEDLVKRLFSDEHLLFILGDHALFLKFSTFLNRYQPHLVPSLIRFLEMRKSMKAIDYANAVARKLQWPSHTDYNKLGRVQAAQIDLWFDDYANKELLLLCREALPAWITHTLTTIVIECVAKEITGNSLPAIQDLVSNLAEVFCLTEYVIREERMSQKGNNFPFSPS
jgi:hypothetical protein